MFRRIKHIATTVADIPRLVKGEHIKLKAQQEGDPDLEYQTALYMYEQKEDNEAFDFMKKAAQKGHIEAQYQLAWHYHEKEEEVLWLTRAAEKGHLEAQHLLAQLFGKGFHREIREATNKYLPEYNKEKSDYYLEMAAKGGHLESQAQMAKNLYEEGDIEAAIVWYEKAANAGNYTSKFYLGLHYLYHASDEYKDTAKYWFEKAVSPENYLVVRILVENYNKDLSDYNVDIEKYNEYIKKEG